jgi:cell division protein FtsN
MKQTDIVKIIAADFKTKNVDELNKLLKAKDAPSIRYRVSGKKVGHLGFTGTIKAIADNGIKVFDVNKVTLIKFTDIEKFEKAKPKVARPEKAKAAPEEKVAAKTKTAPTKAAPTKTAAPTKKATITKATEAKVKKVDNDDDDWEDHSPKAFGSEKFRPRAGKGGSNFIPNPKKK